MCNGFHFHRLLIQWDMVIPATFIEDLTGGATWTSNSGVGRRYDFVAVSRSVLPFVAAAGVDLNIHLGIGMHQDHKVSALTLHLEYTNSKGAWKKASGFQ